MHLTSKVMKFISAINENGGRITKDEQDQYGSVAYYIMIGYLRNHNIVEHDGNTDGNQKIWIFTEKGKIVAKHIEDLRRILDGDEKQSNSSE